MFRSLILSSVLHLFFLLILIGMSVISPPPPEIERKQIQIDLMAPRPMPPAGSPKTEAPPGAETIAPPPPPPTVKKSESPKKKIINEKVEIVEHATPTPTPTPSVTSEPTPKPAPTTKPTPAPTPKVTPKPTPGPAIDIGALPRMPRATPGPAVELPAAVQTESLSSQTGDFAINVNYAQNALFLIQQNFRPPYSAPNLRCVVYFQILKDGTITQARIKQSSGRPDLDQAAMRALSETELLPALYDHYSKPFMEAEVVFEFEKR
jgi:protein TonB